MSLDQFKSLGNESPEETTSDLSNSGSDWDRNWHLKLEGYWESVDESLFDEDSPNSVPLMAVPEKLAAEIEITDEPEVVEQVAKWWDEERSDQYVEVARILFNDLSTWHIPLRPWSKDYANIREGILKRYVPQVIKWEAILEGKDPDKALEEWDKPWNVKDPEWFNDVDDTGLTEDTRKWLNEDKDWLPHISKEINSNNEEVDLDVEDGWEDDW